MIEAGPKPFKFTISDDDLLRRVKQDIDDAEAHFTSYVRDQVIQRIRLVRAEKEYYEELFPRLSKRSTVVSTDVEDTIEWILPSLIRIFWGGTEVVSVTGKTVEDNPEAMQSLIHFQVQKKNPGFTVFAQWFRDVLETGFGILSCEWNRDYYTQTEELTLGVEEFLALDPAGVIDVADLGNGQYWVKRKAIRMRVNQPRLQNIPASEYIFCPELNEDGRSPFEARRFYMTEGEIRRLAKLKQFSNIEDALAKSTGPNEEMDELDQKIRPYRQDSLFGEGWGEGRDRARKKHLVYRCFAQYDVNNDGLLEDVVVTVIGDTIVQKRPNPEGRSPFHTIVTLPQSYSTWGRGIADLIQDMQDLKTALLRQIIVNVASNNDRKIIIDSSQKTAFKDISEDRAAVRLDDPKGVGIRQLVDFFPHSPLSPETFTFWETLQSMVENKTGVTRYNQGLDANSLNKTATGITQIMTAAQQRIELMARFIAETGVMSLFRHLVSLNQRYIDQDQVVRLTNQPMIIRPDDLAGDYDIEVASGLGTGNKQQNVQNMSLLVTQLIPQLMSMGLASPQNLYNAAAKLIQEMGYKNVDDYLLNPANPMGGMIGTPMMPGQPPMMPGQPPMMPGQPPMMPPATPGQVPPNE